jgi:hypothetical protein
VSAPRPVLLAVVSDLHCGGTTAMCPPAVPLDDGGAYVASKAQRWLWDCWKNFWRQAAERRDALGAQLVVVLNGDLVEGHHHRTTQVASGNPTAQAAIVTAALELPLALRPERVFVVRGTAAHAGTAGSTEESIAQGLKRHGAPLVGDDSAGTASWWHLRAEWHGVLVDVAHHGRTGQREHTRAGAAALHAHDILLSHVKSGERAPALCLRGHYHRWNDSYGACPVRVVTTGAWQLATEYVHKVAADSLADIGGALVTITPDGRADVAPVLYRAQRGTPWREPT